MYADTQEGFLISFSAFKDKHEHAFPEFFVYFMANWYERIDLWVKAWRKDATFHTNNYVESYHNQLKSFYFGRTRNQRVDRIVYLLSQVVINDYRQEAVQVQFGLIPMYLSTKEHERKSKADAIDINQATYMIIQTNENLYHCQSFTNPDITYNITSVNDCLSSCSCPDPSDLCKHIFLVSRVKLVPYSSRRPITHSQPSSSAVIDTITDKLRCLQLQENYINTSSRLSTKLNTFLQLSKNQPDKLEHMIDNIHRLEHIVDASICPNSTPSRQH